MIVLLIASLCFAAECSKIYVVPQSDIVGIGATISFNCSSVARANLSMSWSKIAANGTNEPISPLAERIYTESESDKSNILVLRNIAFDDAGVFKCIGTSGRIGHFAIAQLSVVKPSQCYALDTRWHKIIECRVYYKGMYAPVQRFVPRPMKDVSKHVTVSINNKSSLIILAIPHEMLMNTTIEYTLSTKFHPRVLLETRAFPSSFVQQSNDFIPY